MKKFLVAGLLAIGLVAITQQQASAWVNSKFGVGLNWDYQGGGNQILWGMWRNGQPPGPEAFNAGPYQPTYRGPMQAPQGPFFGGSFEGQQTYEPPYASTYQAPAASPNPAPAAAPYQAPYAAGYQTPFQFANYPRQSNHYYYYPAPSYNYYNGR